MALAVRMEANRLPKTALLGELESGERSSEGQESDRLKRLQEDEEFDRLKGDCRRTSDHFWHRRQKKGRGKQAPRERKNVYVRQDQGVGYNGS